MCVETQNSVEPGSHLYFQKCRVYCSNQMFLCKLGRQKQINVIGFKLDLAYAKPKNILHCNKRIFPQISVNCSSTLETKVLFAWSVARHQRRSNKQSLFNTWLGSRRKCSETQAVWPASTESMYISSGRRIIPYRSLILGRHAINGYIMRYRTSWDVKYWNYFKGFCSTSNETAWTDFDLHLCISN